MVKTFGGTPRAAAGAEQELQCKRKDHKQAVDLLGLSEGDREFLFLVFPAPV